MATILLVEDEMVIALGATMILEDAGHTVLLAPNGAAGLAQALEFRPELIVTDYMMPRMDGFAMIRELRDRGVTIPIVLATSIGEDRLHESSHRLYDAYLGKPYRECSLISVVERLLASVSS